jgi:hypothetical protein
MGLVGGGDRTSTAPTPPCRHAGPGGDAAHDDRCHDSRFRSRGRSGLLRYALAMHRRRQIPGLTAGRVGAAS